jgi:ABC-type multidrug transport system permease subunit
LLAEGEIIYHGPRQSVVPYFSLLGYQCPPNVDEADYLQELPTPDGRRFLINPKQPHSSPLLVKAWKTSDLYQHLLLDMQCAEFSQKRSSNNLENGISSLTRIEHAWYPDQNESFAKSFWFYFWLQLQREGKIVIRDSVFIKSRIGQSLLIGAVSGSLFSNIGVTDINTMNGFLFNSVLFGALASFAIVPMVYEQKAVFYKQSDSLFYPTSTFTLAQSICLFPLQVVEQILYVLIVYWSAGLSQDYNGSRFFTFIVVSLAFAMCISQWFRLLAAIIPDQHRCLPMCGKFTNVDQFFISLNSFELVICRCYHCYHGLV